MKEFDEGAVCPKCGHPEAKVVYHDGIRNVFGCSDTKEHLHRTCTRCSYSWREKCLDAQAVGRSVIACHRQRTP